MESISPQIKFESSPTDSLLSDPSGVFPSLFSASASTIASSGAATPVDSGVYGDVMNAETQVVDLERLDELYVAQAQAQAQAVQVKTETAPEKKTGKKRKSWGQVLPEPKTNLPPRKRAKTEDEKEQRRVERVLRNRRAAQSSRERKRLEVDALERRNRELEAALAKAQNENLVLYTRLCQLEGKPGVVAAAGAPVTLSRELFGAQNDHAGLSPHFLTPSSTPSLTATIDPVSLSPAMRPVPDASAGAAVDTKQPLLQTLTPLPSPPSKSLDAGRPAADDAQALSVGGGASGSVCANALGGAGRGDAVPGDFVAVPFLGGVYDVLPTGDADSFAASGYLVDAHAAGSQLPEYSGYLVDSEPLPPLFAAGGSDFDIGDFFNADGLASTAGGDAARGPLRRGAGEYGAERPCMTEDA